MSMWTAILSWCRDRWSEPPHGNLDVHVLQDFEDGVIMIDNDSRAGSVPADEVSGATGRTRLALEDAVIVANEQIAPQVHVVTLSAPRCARLCLPGQFVHIMVPGDATELLRLPFSVYRSLPEEGTIALMYQTIGRGTQRLSMLLPGTPTDLIGPIGGCWDPPEGCSRALLVSGGLGAAPLVMLAEQLADRGVGIDICMGAPTSSRLVAREDLARCGELHIATDDGSEGSEGFCTQVSELLLQDNDYDYLATCGPYPMERIVARQAEAYEVYCEVSLETLMACGVGACLSCVVDTVEGKRRVCVDGPIFDAGKVVW